MQDIASKYIEMAKQAAAGKEYDKAIARLDKAAEITPGAENRGGPKDLHTGISE